MPIRGSYNPQTDMIVLDTASNLFGGVRSVTFHEQAHYYLTNYTNHGAVYSLLRKADVDPNRSKAISQTLLGKLHTHCYLPQEGIAHFIQYLCTRGDDGISMRDFERPLPHEPKVAFSYLHFAEKLPKDVTDKITEKLSGLAMNTDLHQRVINENLLGSESDLNTYLSIPANSPNERFKKLCVAFEKDPLLIDKSDEAICRAAGITLHPMITNAEKAALINKTNEIVGIASNATEADITSYASTEEALLPSFEGMSFRDAAIDRAHVNHDPDAFLGQTSYFRTVFIFNNPETKVHDDLIGYYAFLKKNIRLNGRLRKSQIGKLLSPLTTRVVDTHTFNYEDVSVKDERVFIQPNIVWYKSFQDFRIMLDSAKKHGFIMEASYVAFTESHEGCYYLFRIKGQPSILHVLATYNFFIDKIDESGCNIERIDLFQLVQGNEVHLNNFLHDMLGIPYPFDFVEMARDAEAYLKKAKKRIDDGIGRNETCICGSQRKWKKCHES